MKAAIVVAVVVGLAGCSGSDVLVCADQSPDLGVPITVAEVPRSTVLPRAVLGDNGSVLVWGEITDDPGQSMLRARCLSTDGADTRDVALRINGQMASLHAARAGARYHVVYGAWAGGNAEDPVSHFAIDIGCDGAVTAQRPIGTPSPYTAVTGLVSFRDGHAFLMTTPDALTLSIDAGGAVTTRTIAASPVWATLAASEDEVAVVTLAPTGATITTFGADGAPTSGPIDVPGTADTYDGRVCWDGAGWSVVVNTRREGRGEVRYARLDASTTPPVSRSISDGTGASYDPAIACADGTAALAFRRNAGDRVPGTDLVTSTIQLVELAIPDGAVIHGPIELEPPAARLSMFPTVWTGAHLIATWTAFDADGYEQRFAATAGRCGL